MNLGLIILFFPMVTITQLRRGRTPDVLKKLDIGGWVGCGNIELTGAGGSTFHVELRPGIVRVGLGAREDADGTITLGVDTFFSLLSGHGSFAGAMMTGSMRIQGEGHLSFMIGTLASQFQAAASGKYPGALGVLGPWWARLVLMFSDKSLYEPEADG